jgi:dTDP-glucose 4,6-dehydratase
MNRQTTSTARTNGHRPQVVITGGAGFVGSHLCEFFLARDCSVTCIDNLITGRMENIRPCLEHPSFSFIRHDVTDLISLDCHADYVIHMASTASPRDYYRYPIETMKAGAFGTYNALNIALASNARFLLTSTSEVYGDPEVNPQPESYVGRVNPVGPRSVYDEAKRFAEAMTMAYARKHGLDVRIARIFNTYGHRMRIDDGRLIPNFFMQALRDEPLTVNGDGTQTRSLCYVDDLVLGIYNLVSYPPSIIGRDYDVDSLPIFNLGNPEEVRVIDIASEILELTDSRSEMIFCPLPENDPRLRRPDISKARNILNWEPEVKRTQGLKLVLPYFQGILETSFESSAMPSLG